MSLNVINKRVEDLYQEWNSLQPLNPDNDYRLWRKIKLEWNYNSNRIEGNTLSYSETKLLLIHGRACGDHLLRDYEEMKAHNLGIEKVREFAEDKERHLTETDIQNLNLIILKEPFWKEAVTSDGQTTKKKIVPGKYKTQPNHVRTGTGEVFMFALPQEVPEKMGNLMNWFNENIESRPTPISPFLAELHHRFICIHPFDDGNGRIARLWMNYALMRLGYPPLVIKAADKDGYTSALQKADTGNLDDLAVYLGSCLISWLDIGIKNAGRADITPLSKKDLEKLCEQSWIPLLEMFENQFSQFSELFSSMKTISGWLEEDASLGNFKKHIREQLENQGVNLDDQRFMIFYEGYKTGSKPFNLQINLLLYKRPYDIEYVLSTAVYPGHSPHRVQKKTSEDPWTELEIMRFVTEGKKAFLEVLREKTAETENDDS